MASRISMSWRASAELLIGASWPRIERRKLRILWDERMERTLQSQ